MKNIISKTELKTHVTELTVNEKKWIKPTKEGDR
jgi:hypothetical protein